MQMPTITTNLSEISQRNFKGTLKHIPVVKVPLKKYPITIATIYPTRYHPCPLSRCDFIIGLKINQITRKTISNAKNPSNP